MFEINFNGQEILDYYKNERKAYKDGEYDFTFENRFLIYHSVLCHELHYLALDTTTGLSSEVTRRKLSNPIKRSEYKGLTPLILSAIRYTGVSRAYNPIADDPLQVIDSIFRVILAEHGYAIREEQIRLSKNIYKGLCGKLVSICEAEVGTGKTLAYLVAALVAKNANENFDFCKPITITTSSIELQRALVEKEIPSLSAMLMKYNLIKKPLSVVIRKGKEHYFCKKRYEDLVANLKQHPEKHQRILDMFEVEDFAGTAFDLDSYNIGGRLKGKICVKGSCQKCKYIQECRYHNYLASNCAKEDLDFQVVNHNMFLASIKVKDMTGGKVIRHSDIVIIDEAHKFKDSAEDMFGTELTLHHFERYLNVVKTLRSEGFSPEQYKNLMDNVRLTAEGLFSRLNGYLNTNDLDEDRGTLIELSRDDVGALSALALLIRTIEANRDKAEGEHKNVGKDLLSALEVFHRQNNINVWVDIDENGVFTLCCAPKNVAQMLHDKVWNCGSSFVLTSGTMSDGTDFSFFMKENGIDRIRKELVFASSTPSPFDYKNHTRLYIPDDMLHPDNDSKKYIKRLSERICDIVDATNGHTAILFTSYKVLSSVYELTHDRLAKYDVICMTRSNKTAISEFKRSNNGVLFASGSMWEGVDCIGDSLSSVIIVRAPFPMRSATLEQKKNDIDHVPTFIQTFAVPEMLIKLRQGVGRLIRSENDTGLVSILDCRVAEDGKYQDKVMTVLAKYPKVETLEEVKEFFKAVKPKEYFKN